jgi:hypothetical protein
MCCIGKYSPNTRVHGNAKFLAAGFQQLLRDQCKAQEYHQWVCYSCQTHPCKKLFQVLHSNNILGTFHTSVYPANVPKAHALQLGRQGQDLRHHDKALSDEGQNLASLSQQLRSQKPENIPLVAKISWAHQLQPNDAWHDHAHYLSAKDPIPDND